MSSMYDKFFLEGKFDAEIMVRYASRSPLWPVFVALHNATNGEVRISNIVEDREMQFCTATGAQFAQVQRLHKQTSNGSKEYYAFDFYNHPLRKYGSDTKPELKSTNPKYIANKLKGMTGSISYHLFKCHKMVPWLLDYFLSYGLLRHERAFRKLRKKPALEVTRDDLQEKQLLQLVRLAIGDMDRSQLTSDLVTYCDSKIAKLAKDRQGYEQMKDDFRAFFARDKVIVINGVCNGVIVAEINKDYLKRGVEYALSNIDCGYPFEKQCDDIYKEANVRISERLDGKVTNSIKWYPSLDAVPDPLRTSVNASLMMLKVHTNSTGSFPETPDNADCWLDIGAGYVEGGGAFPAYLIEV